MRSFSTTLLLILLSALGSTAGCSSEEARSQSGSGLAEDSFGARVTFCRKISQKTGRPIGAGDEFQITSKSYVNALVDFRGVAAGRTYVLHLVWVRPDGKEIFRKYAEVVQTEDGDSGFQTVISWLDGTDLHDIDRDTLATEISGFTLKSRLNISQKKERDPGLYGLRVYLDRRFLLAEDFRVL